MFGALSKRTGPLEIEFDAVALRVKIVVSAPDRIVVTSVSGVAEPAVQRESLAFGGSAVRLPRIVAP